MREGFYSIIYAGTGGDMGFGMIALDNGRFIGADVVGGLYDGEYAFNPRTDLIEGTITMTVPAGVVLVTGTAPQPEEWKFDFPVAFPRETPETPVRVDLPTGPVNVIIKFVRSFPD